MRTYDSATLAALASRAGIVTQRLVWIGARSRSTGLVEALGLTSGVDDLTVTLGGQLRTYTAAGALLQSEPVTAGSGLEVRIHQLQMAAIDPRVKGLVKGYDTRFAPVEIHRAIFHPETRALVAAPHRVFKGMVNSIEFPTAEPGASPSCIVELASETRALTRALATKKSDDSHQARAGDRFRRYGDISGTVPVYWGELMVSAPADPAPTAPADTAPSNISPNR